MGYTSRLWCIWELFSLTAFLPMDRVLQRIQIEPLDKDIDGLLLARQLLVFNVVESQTYDPNERTKLLLVIDAIGRKRFNEKIHELGNHFVEGIGGSARRASASRSSRLSGTISATTCQSHRILRGVVNSKVAQEPAASTLDKDVVLGEQSSQQPGCTIVTI